jgi:hypothetical protein
MMLESLVHIWPLLLISIPFAVVLRVSGLSEKLRGAFGRRPILGVFLATAAGAFGPFCSCSVVPVITSMLIGGVPLAPVMSFWIASPTMDPEIFFMSAAFLGWPLAVARLVATLLLSLSAGLITHGLVRRGWVGAEFLRIGVASPASPRSLTARAVAWLRRRARGRPAAEMGVAADVATEEAPGEACGCACGAAVAGPEDVSRGWSRQGWLTGERARLVFSESLRATVWVAKFMTLAFLLEALIKLTVPQDLIVGLMGTRNLASPALATAIGIPMYTGNLTALPLIGGLLEQGMDPGAALAYLIAGPVTTLPAMAAVWGVVKRRVFFLYLALGVLGALALGYAYSFASFLHG